MGKFKEELAYHIEYCEIFSHHIMLIGAFTAWVRGPSILFTFILKRCHAFIIIVIVVTKRSIIFIEHFLWHLITVNHSWTNFHLCPTVPNSFPACDFQMGTHPSIYEPWDWLVWTIDSSQPTMVIGSLDQMSSHVVTFWVLSLAFWIKVLETGIIDIDSCLLAAIQQACELFQLAKDRTLEQFLLAKMRKSI